MLVDLISVVNQEGLPLDGAFYAPAADAQDRGPVDAMLLIHGSRGNFCDPATKSMAADLSAQGIACLALNTNAHDTIWYHPPIDGYKGNAFEILENTMSACGLALTTWSSAGIAPSACWDTAWERCA